MAVDRGGRTDVRQRRLLQKLGQDALGTLDLLEGDGIVFDFELGEISVDLASTTPGLRFTDGLTVDLRDTDPGLELTATGLGILLGSNPGLTTASGLRILLDTNPGLELGSGGLKIDLDSNPGLVLGSGGIKVLLATNSGLTLTGGLAISTTTPDTLVISGSTIDLDWFLSDGTNTTVVCDGNSGVITLTNPGSGGDETNLVISKDAFTFSYLGSDIAVIGTLALTTYTNVAINAIGAGLQIAEGSDARLGTAVMVAGTVTVNNSTVTAKTRIFLTINTPGGTVGSVYVSARTAGTSFTITSTSVLDTSTVAWLLVEALS